MPYALDEASQSIKSNEKMEDTFTSINVKLGTTLIDILTSISVSTSFGTFFESIDKLIVGEIVSGIRSLPFLNEVMNIQLM